MDKVAKNTTAITLEKLFILLKTIGSKKPIGTKAAIFPAIFIITKSQLYDDVRNLTIVLKGIRFILR